MVQQSTVKLTERELRFVRRENLQWIFIAQGVAILPLLVRLPVWLWAVWAMALAWRIQIYRERLPFPSSVTKFVIGIGAVVGLGISYLGQVSVEPMVGFLVCSFILKLLELRTQKDALLILFIGFIAVAAQFLFAQTIAASVYGIVSCVVLITAWQTVYYSRYFPARHKLKRGALLVLQSLPMMLVLFLVMPRIGPLWSVPMPDSSGKTGFGEKLSPGDLGRLVKSDGIAFRAIFDDLPPPTTALYWRGLVLDDFDGRTWTLRRGWEASALQTQVQFSEKGGLRYSITVEPHMRRWLFSLMPVKHVNAPNMKARITEDYLISTAKPLSSRSQYSLVSAWASKQVHDVDRLSSLAYMVNTRLPRGSNPEARELAAQWRNETQDPRELIAKAIQMYGEKFYYTLQPPILGRHSIDEFLFKTRRGFCEHFASSFVFLMRAAQVPARVVVGYQGGTPSEVDDYIVVSQADAHAWAEVWVKGEGWIRVDPTAAVAPTRIEMGLSDALSEIEREMVGVGLRKGNNFFGRMQQYWDAVGFSWHRWVLGYDKSSQLDVFKKLLGGVDYWRVGLALFLCGLLIFGGYALMLLLTRNKPYLSPEALLYQQFEKKLERKKLQREPNESPSAFAARVGDQVPEYKTSASKIAELHDEIAYAGKESKMTLLKRYVRAFPALP